MISRCAPDAALAGLPHPRGGDCRTEAARVAFMTALGSRFYAASRQRLPLRRLYRCGGGAVAELRRLAGALQQQQQQQQQHSPQQQQQQPMLDRAELRGVQQSIAASGAALVEALASAPAAAAAVQRGLSVAEDLPALRSRLLGEVASARQQAAQLRAAVATLEQEQTSLEGD